MKRLQDDLAQIECAARRFSGNGDGGSSVRANGVGSGPATRQGRGDKSVPMQPAAEHGLALERAGFAREIGEHGLDNVLGEVRVAAGAPERDGINEIDVTADEFPKRRLGPLFQRNCAAIGRCRS